MASRMRRHARASALKWLGAPDKHDHALLVLGANAASDQWEFTVTEACKALDRVFQQHPHIEIPVEYRHLKEMMRHAD